MKPTRASTVFLAVVVLSTVGGACPQKSTRPAASTDKPTEVGKVPEAPKAPEPSAPRFAPLVGQHTLTVLWTASVEGYVEPCGCTAEPLGGIARYVAAVDEAKTVRGADHVLVLDAGNLLFERADDNLPADLCQTTARHKLLVETYRKAGVSFTVLGDKDDARGAEYRDGLLDAAGLTTLHGGAPMRTIQKGQASALVDVAGTKVGLFGYTAPADQPTNKAAFVLSTLASTLRKQGAAVVIGLLQTPVNTSRALGQKLTGVDVLIQGKDPGERPRTPERLGETGPLLVAAGMQAQYLGVLELLLDGHQPGIPLPLDDRRGQAQRRIKVLDARIKQLKKRVEEVQAGSPKFTFLEQKLIAARDERAQLQRPTVPLTTPHLAVRSIELSRGSAEDAAAKAALAAYEKSVPDLVSQCEADITCPEPAAGQAVYVGVESCAGCHDAAVKFWQKARVTVLAKDKAGNVVRREVGHSKAWDTLRQAGKDKDRTCVGCHSIGFNQPGGYCKVSDIGFRTDVQCEACHGPGSNHVNNAGDKSSLTVRSVTEATCRGCHHVPHIPTTESFVFDEKLKAILGPGHGLPVTP